MLYMILPIAIIVVIFVFAMPIMKKQAANASKGVMAIQNMPVHLYMLAGTIKTINGKPEQSFTSINGIYGLEETGELTIEFTPAFVHANTTYTGTEPMSIRFAAEQGKSYQISVEPKEPSDKTNILDVSPVVNQKLVFKTTFYIITKDISDEKDAKAMRGNF